MFADGSMIQSRVCRKKAWSQAPLLKIFLVILFALSVALARMSFHLKSRIEDRVITYTSSNNPEKQDLKLSQDSVGFRQILYCHNISPEAFVLDVPRLTPP